MTASVMRWWRPRPAEALEPFRNSLAIREKLAAIDPGNTQWQQRSPGTIDWHYIKAAVDKDGELAFSLDVLASGGITIENIKENDGVFDVLLDELTKFDPRPRPKAQPRFRGE